MSVLVIAEVPEGTAELDEAMMKALNLADDPPAGVRVRVAGPTETGWRIVSLWDSQDAFDAFRRDRLAPALEQAGRAVPEFQFWPIESVIIR
jgi:heme-degrading monooxygenase HmoA